MTKDERRFQLASAFFMAGAMSSEAIEKADLFMKAFEDSEPEFRDVAAFRAQVKRESLNAIANILVNRFRDGSLEYHSAPSPRGITDYAANRCAQEILGAVDRAMGGPLVYVNGICNDPTIPIDKW